MTEIVSFTEEHLEGVVRVENECFDVPWTRESLKEQIYNPNAKYFILLENGIVAGYGGLWHILDEGDINNIGILPKMRRKGYGSMILLKLIDYMKENNLSFLNLEVRESNLPAIALYKKHGFYEVGRRKKYYGGKEAALLLRRDNT